MSGILEGVRIVDMTVAIAVPTAAAMMAGWGADVIKVESPYGEAQMRGTTVAPQAGAMYMIGDLANTDKRGLAIDLKKPGGIEVFHKLVETADIFMSNFPIRTLRGLKADYETLSQVNPRIIHCILSAYGRHGPLKDERGYDYAAGWARGGLQYMHGGEDGEPILQRQGVIDRVAAGYLTAGIMGALYHKEKTGKGQQLELSLFHTAIWADVNDIQSALMGKEPPKYTHMTGVAMNPLWNYYKTKDGKWFQLASQGGIHWPEFCRGVERPDLIDDPRFNGGMEALREHAVELIKILDDTLITKTRDEWEKSFRANDVIYGLVQTPMEVTKDPQAIANNIFADVEHPALGKIKMVKQPIDFHQNPVTLKTTAPELGQHTEEILLDIGYSWEDITRLKEQQVIP